MPAIILAGFLSACRTASPASAEALYRDGRLQIRLGNLKSALASAEAGWRQWRKQPDSPYYWKFRLLRAEALLAMGNPKDALGLLESAVPAQTGLAELAVRTTMDQGYARLMLGQFPEAKRLLDDAIQRAPENGALISTAEIEILRGTVLARMGDARAAEQSFQRARDLAVRHHDIYLQANAVGSLGYNRLQSTRYDEAIPFFEDALRLGQNAGARLTVTASSGNLGRCYYLLGDYGRAVAMLTKAESSAAETGDGFREQLWAGALGDSYYALGEFRKALPYYQRALALSRRADDRLSSALWLDSLTVAAMDENDWAAAEAYNREALELSGQMQSPATTLWSSLHHAVILTQQKRYRDAEAGLRQALASAERIGERVAIWEAHAGLGNIYVQTERWTDAEAEFQSALNAVETARAHMARDEWKLSFHASSIRFYQDYVEFLMSRGRQERALEVAEASRARLLAQKLGLKQGELRLTPAARFREIARRNGALVSYWVAPRRSFVWVVRPAGIRSFVLPPERQLKPLVQAYNTAIQDLRDPLETGNPAGQKLSEALLGPVGKLVPPGSRAVIVSDGCLHELPLGALPVNSPRPHYWQEDVALALTPSLALLDASAGSSRTGKSLLLIGNPVPPGNEYAPLPDAGREVESIQRRFRAAVYTGAAASPQAYRDAGPARFGLIHFTAHAVANRESPLDSAVILSRKGDSYKLYAREVVGVPLHARLVTISACRGAGARLYSGEGLVGFAWAFLQSGAQNVIAGLWDVNDRSTAALMDRLYAQMASRRSPAQALHEAKLGLIRSSGPWRKPYYWAAFQTFSRYRPFE